MKLYKARRRRLAVLTIVVALLTSGHAAAQEHELPLHVMRSATLERLLLVMPSDASSPGEAYVGSTKKWGAVVDLSGDAP